MPTPALFPDLEDVHKSATLSECGLYRYDLTRTWETGPHVTFIMFNPSTADASVNDPTIVRCIGFARSWGFCGLVVVNLFAYRATDPAELWKVADPVGPMNDLHIECHAFFGHVVAAWGAKPKAKHRVAEVRAMLKEMGRPLRVIRMTKSGHPEHPLFLPGNLKPQPWEA